MKNVLSVILLLTASLATLAMEGITHSELGTAAEKLYSITQKIAASAYKELPQIVMPGFDGANLMNPEFIAKAFTNDGNAMEEVQHDAIPGLSALKRLCPQFAKALDCEDAQVVEVRPKVIHTFGTTIQVAFEVDPESELKLSGIFQSGAPFGLLRLSLAQPSAHGVYTPGFAMALFRDNQPSANIFAMPSLDGIETNNLFASDFVTSLPHPAFSLKMKLLENRFEKAMHTIGVENPNIRALTLNTVAQYDGQGQLCAIKAPYSLVFKPTKAARKLLKNNAGDFRAVLSGKGTDLTLFEVYAIMTEGDTTQHRVGFIKGTSHFIASSYGDEHLYFKHPPVHTLQ